MRKLIRKIPYFIRIPLVVFLVSLCLGMILSALVHISLKHSEDSLREGQWQQQIPLLRTVLTSKLASKSLNDKQGRGISAFFQTNFPGARVVIFRPDHKPMFHNDPQKQKLITSALEDPEIRLKDAEILSAKAEKSLRRMAAEKIGFLLDETDNTVFFPVPVEDENYHVMLDAGGTGISFGKVIVSIYLISLFLSLIVALVSYAAVRQMAEPLNSILDSLFTVRSENRFEPIEAETDDEIGDALIRYNHLMDDIMSNLTSGTPHQESSGGPSFVSTGIDSVNFLQTALADRPVAKMEGMELALYPRVPHPMSHSFLSSATQAHETQILLTHFDASDLSGQLSKHRIQQKFFALAGKLEADQLAEEMFAACREEEESGPGILLLLRSEQGVRICRSGPFAVFELDVAGQVSVVHKGENAFRNQFNGFEVVETEEGAAMLILSSDIMAALNQNEEEIMTNFLSGLRGKSAKDLLAGLLNRIFSHHENMTTSAKIPGTVALLRWKS